MSESKKKVIRNKTAKILYPIYAILFAGAAVVCYSLFQNIMENFEGVNGQLSKLFWLFVMAIVFLVFAVITLAHALAAYLCKGEHDYLRISSQWAILVAIFLFPVMIIAAGSIGDYKHITGDNLDSSVNADGDSMRFSDTQDFYKFCLSKDPSDYGNYEFEHNKFGSLASFTQSVDTMDNKYTKNTRLVIGFAYCNSSIPAIYNCMSVDPSDYTTVETCDGYMLYSSVSRNNEDGALYYDYELVIQNGHSVYYSDCTAVDYKGGYKDQFVKKALENYQLILQQEQELSQ